MPSTDLASADSKLGLPDDVLFCGDLSIAAHQRSAVWLARMVMPALRHEVADARLVLMGRGLPKSIRKLASLDWVELVDLSEGSMPEVVRMSRCVVGVASQRQARGAAMPTLMMMSLGRPMVCTPAVLYTLPGETAAAPALAETGPQIANAIARLINDRRRAMRCGMHARRLVQQCATWEQQWRRVGALLSQLGEAMPVKVKGDAAQLRDLTEMRTAPLAGKAY